MTEDSIRTLRDQVDLVGHLIDVVSMAVTDFDDPRFGADENAYRSHFWQGRMHFSPVRRTAAVTRSGANQVATNQLGRQGRPPGRPSIETLVIARTP